MGAMASQITSLTIIHSTVYSGGIKENIKAPFTGLCAGNSSATGELIPRTEGKMFPFDDVIMNAFWATP